MSEQPSKFVEDYGPQRLTVELANICNLHCSYCFRAEDNLYSNHAVFFSLDLLRRLLKDAIAVAEIKRVTFTGGEPTLHPQFSEILRTVREAGLTASFVTNGWHFERVWPLLVENRQAISHVAFSLDGISREIHDGWRGNGSFDRLIKAFSLCYMKKVPFVIKMTIRRDMMDQLEQAAIFAARMGASALNFVHLMPTSTDLADDSALTLAERRITEQEIAILSRIFKMKLTLDVGYYNIDEERAPCSPLAGTSMNIDYQGRLSLCCNLSGYRGSIDEKDVVADLNNETFESAYTKLAALVEEQLTKRANALASLRLSGVEPDLYTGSPCLFCLQSYGKIPWHASPSAVSGTALPVFNSN